ncbi:MAG: helix-turn-helix domain-containing protein [Burkholderiales bacterium]|nr:helix-turn-helix domain-containing protein [Burkholderiales bacterium]
MANPTVKSAQRALEVLEFFADWRRPATVKEISTTLGYPQSSTSVLLKCMKESGYFDHDARTGMYSPNVRLALATAWISQQLYSEQSLLRLMEKVLADTGHTVMIGARHGVHVRYLHVLQATRVGSFTAKTGALRPLFRSAAGKMLLTTVAERDVAKMLRRANALELDDSLRTALDDVLAERKRCRLAGYALSRGTSLPGAAALAVLLPVPIGSEPLSLSLGGPLKESDAERNRLLTVLQESILPFAEAARSG